MNRDFPLNAGAVDLSPEQWQPHPLVRRLRRDDPQESRNGAVADVAWFSIVLQQLWISTKGRQVWRDVPLFNEQGEVIEGKEGIKVES